MDPLVNTFRNHNVIEHHMKPVLHMSILLSWRRLFENVRFVVFDHRKLCRDRSIKLHVIAGGVLVMGATNRPAAIDAALLRPGRFDAVLYVPPPDVLGRAEALRVHTRGMALAPDVDLAATAAATPLFTGAGACGVTGV